MKAIQIFEAFEQRVDLPEGAMTTPKSASPATEALTVAFLGDGVADGRMDAGELGTSLTGNPRSDFTIL